MGVCHLQLAAGYDYRIQIPFSEHILIGSFRQLYILVLLSPSLNKEKVRLIASGSISNSHAPAPSDGPVGEAYSGPRRPVPIKPVEYDH